MHDKGERVTCEFTACACEDGGGPWRPCVDGLVCLGCFGRADDARWRHFHKECLALRQEGGRELYSMHGFLSEVAQ